MKANSGLGENISTNFCSANASKRKTMVAVPLLNFKPSIATNLCRKMPLDTRDVWRKNESGLSRNRARCVLPVGLKRFRYVGVGVIDAGRRFHLRVHYFVPARAIERRLELDESDLYGRLHEFDNVHVTPGNVTDYDFIRRFNRPPCFRGRPHIG